MSDDSNSTCFSTLTSTSSDTTTSDSTTSDSTTSDTSTMNSVASSLSVGKKPRNRRCRKISSTSSSSSARTCSPSRTSAPSTLSTDNKAHTSRSRSISPASSSSSDEDLFNFNAIHDRVTKEYKESQRALLKKKVDDNPENEKIPPVIDLTSLEALADTISNAINDRHNVQHVVDLTHYSADYSLPSTSQTDVASTSVGRRRRNIVVPSTATVLGPTISVGDFYDGYNIPPPKVKLVEDEFDLAARLRKERLKEEDDKYLILDLNRNVNVRVKWYSTLHKFVVRKFQSIDSVYEHFSKLENITKDQVLLRLNKKRLSPTDTPNSIFGKTVDIIDGEIEYYRSIYDRTASEEEEEDENEANFKVKVENRKHPLFIKMKKTEQMAILYIKLSELLGRDINSFRLEFDGDKIEKSATPESLDLDGDECIELFDKKIVDTC